MALAKRRGARYPLAPVSKTILIVDDDHALRKLFATVLTMRGHHLIQAATGVEGKRLLRTEEPDFVLVDGLLPDTNGIQWIEDIRAAGHRVTVGFLSSFWRDLASYQHLTSDLEVSFVLHKPIQPVTLADRIDRLFAREPQEVSDPTAAVLAQLRDDYVGRLPSIIGELDALVAQSPRDPKAREEAVRLAHSVRGTAGTHGLEGVSRAAGVIEQALLDTSEQLDARRWRRIREALAAMDEEREAEHPPLDIPGAAERTSRILLVDGDRVFAGDVARIARRQLIEIAHARDPSRAVEVVASTDVHGVIIDSFLAGEQAFPLALALRSIPGKERLPIAFTSGDSSVEQRVASHLVGASLFLSKPVPEDDLVQALETLVNQGLAGQPRVLLVDDDPDFGNLCVALLARQGMRCEAITDPRDTEDALLRIQPDLLLLDIQMPGLSGLQVCQSLRLTQRWRELPIVFLTSTLDDRMRINAFRAGADDYITKPVLTEELVARVQVRIDRRRLLRDHIERDSLTGLLLRRAFLERAREQLSYAQRHQQPLTMCLLDIDGLKQVNDTRGHLSGDHVLFELGKLLQQRFRTEDVRARWSGGGFAISFLSADVAVVCEIMDKVLDRWTQRSFHAEDERPFHTAFTAGVAGYPNDGNTIRTLLRVADQRLSHGKSAGRRRVVGADPDSGS